jgi:NadR type nicotinamide-nucleotide adenylyltransferase
MSQTIGLVIGKFMPPHAGHLRLCAVAAAQADELHVVLFSKQNEPIPGALRLEWLRELLPNVHLTHVTAEHTVDFDDAGAWDFWVNAMRAVLPRHPEVVFSSEAYGAELARRLGARHVTVDAARSQVPISATQIRAQPLANWRFIPAPVRPYFARRVALVGAECTGKTTLAGALADVFQTAWVPEYAREYLLAREQPCAPADLELIAERQAALEDKLARQANRVLICDTNLLTTQLWHEFYFGDCPAALRDLARQRTADLSLLCDAGVPWVADSVRDAPTHRAWFQQRFEAELTAQGRPFAVLSGSAEQRLETAISLVKDLLDEDR